MGVTVARGSNDVASGLHGLVLDQCERGGGAVGRVNRDPGDVVGSPAERFDSCVCVSTAYDTGYMGDLRPVAVDTIEDNDAVAEVAGARNSERGHIVGGWVTG